MDNTATARARLLDEQLHADDARKRIERRQWARDFALSLALIALTLAASFLFADLSARIR